MNKAIKRSVHFWTLDVFGNGHFTDFLHYTTSRKTVNIMLRELLTPDI